MYIIVKSSEVIKVVTGVGFTYVNRVFVRVNDFTYSPSGITTSPYYGSYSWGKIVLTGRSGVTSYTSYTTSWNNRNFNFFDCSENFFLEI